jgi:hypothetical protein
LTSDERALLLSLNAAANGDAIVQMMMGWAILGKDAAGKVGSRDPVATVKDGSNEGKVTTLAGDVAKPLMPNELVDLNARRDLISNHAQLSHGSLVRAAASSVRHRRSGARRGRADRSDD